MVNQRANFSEPGGFRWDAVADVIVALKAIKYDKQEPSSGIKADQVEALLDWVGAGVSTHLERLFPRRGRELSEYMSTKCVFCKNIARDLLQDLPTQIAKDFNFSSFGGVPHAATVLKLPVSDDSKQSKWQYVLIDPSFAQMIDHTQGYKLKETDKGAILCEQLIKRGGVLLTDETAKLYTTAFLPESFLRNRLQECGGSYCELLFSFADSETWRSRAHQPKCGFRSMGS